MTETNISQEYLDARLQSADEHFQRLLDSAVEKVNDQKHDLITWGLLLTAASWGDLAARQDTKLIAAVITLAIVGAAVGYFLWRRYYVIKRRPPKNVDE